MGSESGKKSRGFMSMYVLLGTYRVRIRERGKKEGRVCVCVCVCVKKNENGNKRDQGSGFRFFIGEMKKRKAKNDVG